MNKLPVCIFIIILLIIKSNVAASPSATSKKQSHYSYFQVPQDSVKQKASVLKKLSEAFKDLANAIKFKKNARAKEKRIYTLIDSLHLADSTNISNVNKTILSVIDKFKEALQKEQKDRASLNLPLPNQDKPIPSALNIDSIVSVIISKTTSVTKSNQTSNYNKDKLEKLSIIKQIRSNNATPLIKSYDNKRFTFKLEKKAEIFGFYDSKFPTNNIQPEFTFINDLVYNALYLNSATGEVKGPNEIDSPLLADAASDSCKVYFSVLCDNNNNITSFLNNTTAIHKFITDIIAQLGYHKASGINIIFKNLKSRDRNSLYDFVSLVSRAFKKDNYQLFITIPPFDGEGAYDLSKMNNYVDKIFIDFSTYATTTPGPLAPMLGKDNNTLQTSLSRYSIQNIPPSKFIIILPYRGIEWIKKRKEQRNWNPQYITYTTIRSKPNEVIYDEEESSNYMQLDSSLQDILWFDDENTLGIKYNYILENGLGGVGIYCLNYDGGYGELRDELLYRFTKIDTVYLADSMVSKLSFFQRVKRDFYLYNYILENPCAICFNKDSLTNIYINDLNIDSLIKVKKEQERAKYNRIIYATQSPWLIDRDRNIEVFDYLNDELHKILFYITLFLAFLSTAFSIFYFYQIKNNGERWKGKKLMAGILISVIALLVLSAFTYCFTDDLVPLFGVSYSTSKPPIDCNMRDNNCINMPFSTLMMIVAIGIAIGLLIFQFLIIPLLKRDDIP